MLCLEYLVYINADFCLIRLSILLVLYTTTPKVNELKQFNFFHNLHSLENLFLSFITSRTLRNQLRKINLSLTMKKNATYTKKLKIVWIYKLYFLYKSS